MTSDEDHRSAILDAAKYLREVRPLDPAELVDYVSGDIDDSEVRTVLREHAYELGIREREDATFVPVPEEPVDPAFDGVDAFPARYESVIEEALNDRYGKGWCEGESGDRLRAAIRGFKAAYFAGETVDYDEDVALGYAIYHAPSYYAAVQYVLDELGRARLLSRKLRILDVGAGVGGPALGVHDYLDGQATVRYDAVEPSPAADLLRTMLRETGRNFAWSVDQHPIEETEPGGGYDVILFANVLSELADPVEVLTSLSQVLADDGAVVCLAPADRETSLGLREVERAVVDDAGVFGLFGPTMRLWAGLVPSDECWSFDERPALEDPTLQRQLDEGARAEHTGRDPATGEFLHPDVRFSYAICRRDGCRRVPFRASRDEFVPFAESGQHVTNRVDAACVKLSRSLADGGENPVYRLGDGSQERPHFGVLTRETTLNRPIGTAEYGDVLLIRGGLMLWNDDEGAFNLVIDEETTVDRIGPPARDDVLPGESET